MIISFKTQDESAFELFKPEPVNRHLPKWYKEISTELHDPLRADLYTSGSLSGGAQTIKSCFPVRDYLTSGYVILNNADRIITPVANSDPVDFCDHSNIGKLGFHPHDQCPININDKKRHYFKILNPWQIITPPGYSCLFYQPEYFFESRYKLFPSIVDTDAHTDLINLPGVILSEDSFMLNAGKPLMVVFPFKRDFWKSEISFGKIPINNRLTAYLKGVYRKFSHKKKIYR